MPARLNRGARRMSAAVLAAMIGPAMIGTAMIGTAMIGTAMNGTAAAGPLPTTGPSPSRMSEEAVDESALRYYAATRRTDRVEIEIRRLSALHPRWAPPADLWSVKLGDVDEDGLWELFAADRLNALKAAIAAREAREPGWHASADLSAKLRRKELRTRILAGVAARRWGEVAAVAAAPGFEAMSPDVETLWAAAEALVHLDRMAQASLLYRSILRSSDDPRERLATIQKALAFLPITEAESLFALGRQGPDARSEFDGLKLDLTRARLAAWLHDGSGTKPPVIDFQAFNAAALKANDPDQIALAGWYAYRAGDNATALQDFKRAIEIGGDGMVAHGLAHTLRQMGKDREAEEVAFAWHGPLVQNEILFVDLVERELTRPSPRPIEAARLARYARIVLETASGEGAQALAWYAFNTCRPELALGWFQRAVAWFPKEATVYGYALTLQRLGRQQDLLQLANRYEGLFPSVVGVVFDHRGGPPAPDCRADAPRVETSRDRPATGPFPALAPRIVASAKDIVASNKDETPASTALPVPRTGWGQLPPAVSADLRDDGASPAARKRPGFPARVTSENPLRFAASQAPRLQAVAGPWRADPQMPGPLDIRPVSGVLPMPSAQASADASPLQAQQRGLP